MPVFGQIWPFLGPKSNFWGQGVKILVPSYRDSNETPFSCWKHWSLRLQLAARGENVLFWPQNLDIWGQKSIFCLVIAIFVDGANDHYTRGYNFPIGTTPKKFSVSELGVIFWGSPLFLAVFGHWRVRRATFSIIYLAWIQGASAPWHELWQQKQRVSSKLVMTRFQSTLLSWLKAYRMNDRVWKLLTLDLKQSSRVRLLTVWSRSKFVYTKLVETGVKYCLCWASLGQMHLVCWTS